MNKDEYNIHVKFGEDSLCRESRKCLGKELFDILDDEMQNRINELEQSGYVVLAIKFSHFVFKSGKDEKSYHAFLGLKNLRKLLSKTHYNNNTIGLMFEDTMTLGAINEFANISKIGYDKEVGLIV